MFGIDDPWVLSGYLLCLIVTALCVIWGILKWNKDED